MLIINHRVNTIKKLKATPKGLGIEADVRAYNRRLILHHKPFLDGEDFAEFLKHYKHAFLIAEIKCEGIEKEVIRLIEQQGIKNYTLLSVTPPFMFKLINQGISKMAVRFSEFESIETCLNLKGKVEWVFIDNLTRLPVENNSFQKLRKHFKLCLVSPELLSRDEVEITKTILQENPVDAVLTDNPEKWDGEWRR